MIIKIIGIVLVMGIIIVIHELGHFLSAVSIGVYPKEFAIGMGPAIYKKQGKSTLFSLRCLPFGGFCLFDTETQGYDSKGRALVFHERGAISKVYMLLAGPVMNFVLAAVLFTILFSVMGVPVGYEAVISHTLPESPASQAGMQPGDRIVSIDGTALDSWSDLSRILDAKADSGSRDFVIQRDGKTIGLSVEPLYNEDENRVMIGVTVDPNFAILRRSGPLAGIGLGLKQTSVMMRVLVDAVTQMITGRLSVGENLSGPVALVQVIGETVTSGLRNTLLLTAFLSVNLGIMNLLPIPALDGGRIILYLLELARGKPLKLEVEGWINMVGYMLLISLMVFLTYRDLIKVFQ